MKHLLIAAAVLFVATSATCNAAGWDSNDPKIKAWFAEAPVRSCCGEGDAYEADEFLDAKDGVTLIITDDGKNLCHDEWDEEGGTYKSCKTAVPAGTRIFVPEDKLKYAPKNPTGHGVVFLRQGNLEVICAWLPSGT